MKALCWFGCALLAACGSVALPVERCYRLELPVVAVADPLQAGVLRVDELQLGTALDSDRLLQQQGLQLSSRPLARWVAPLDRLVTDALVLGLSRARVCSLVKSAVDAGGEDWTLHGRIVDFAEADGDAGPEGRVTLELWLEGKDGLVFHDEFAFREACDGEGEQAAVAALSRGLQQVVAGVVERLHSSGALAAVHAASMPRTAAPAR